MTKYGFRYWYGPGWAALVALALWCFISFGFHLEAHEWIRATLSGLGCLGWGAIAEKSARRYERAQKP